MAMKVFLNVSGRNNNSLLILSLVVTLFTGAFIFVYYGNKRLNTKTLKKYLTWVAALPFLAAKALSPCHCTNTNFGRLVFGSTTI
jgi:hypothetical protein